MALRDYQHAFVEAALSGWSEYDRLLGVAPTGSGKCWAKGTPMLLASGEIVPVEKLQVGQTLLGPDSEPRSITGTNSGFDDLFEIIPKRHAEPMTVNADHILVLQCTNTKDRLTLPDGSRVESGDVVHITVRDWLRANKTTRHCLKWVQTPFNLISEDNDELPVPSWLLGFWLADGSSWHAEIHKPKAVEMCKPEAESMGWKVHRKKLPDNKCECVSITEGLYVALKDLNLLANKHIPIAYLRASVTERKLLLAGLLDGDGYSNRAGFEIVQKVEKLASDIAILARSLGFAASRSIKSVDGTIYHRLYLTGGIKLPTKRHIHEERHQKKNHLLTGFKVIPVGKGEYHGVTIDGPSRELLMPDGTISHNTIMAAELCRRIKGPILFLADAKELVNQAQQKIADWTGDLLGIGVEMAEQKAQPGDRVVVATAQSIARRLDKWPADYFTHIIIDEAHRNTLGAHPTAILAHFATAKLLGITATPFRSDKRELSEIYENICYEIALPDLIRQQYLSRITVRSVPCNVDLSQVRTQAGDYAAGDLGTAIDPHLDELARILASEAWDRKTVAFLPLIETSKAFAEACHRYGLNAVHVDGVDRSALREDWDVICNAQLLSTGWDEPSVDCVYVVRPTKSTVLYQQMVGRGTRIHPGKDDLLLLDPLWLSSDHRLVRPARLVAKSDQEASSMEGREGDLLEIQAGAEADRLEAMREKMRRSAKRSARTMDAVELALTLDDDALAEYEPSMKWEADAPSQKQLEVLEKFKIDPESITCKGHAAAVLDRVFARMDLKLATVGQMKWLKKFGHPSPHTATFEEASAFLDERFNKNKKERKTA